MGPTPFFMEFCPPAAEEASDSPSAFPAVWPSLYAAHTAIAAAASYPARATISEPLISSA